MYHQQSLCTLDQFYKIKPLTKLESILMITRFLKKYSPYDSICSNGYSKNNCLIL